MAPALAPAPATGTGTDPGNGATTPKPDPNLAARQIDYGQALRTAAVKLVGSLPTLDEQAAVTDATSYAAQIDKYLADPRFALQMKSYFSDMFKMGGTLKAVVGQTTTNVSLDTAPTFAAELVVQGSADHRPVHRDDEHLPDARRPTARRSPTRPARWPTA